MVKVYIIINHTVIYKAFWRKMKFFKNKTISFFVQALCNLKQNSELTDAVETDGASKPYLFSYLQNKNTSNYTHDFEGTCHIGLLLLYPHFLKKVRVYCCYPFLSVRPSVQKKSLSLELPLHFKDWRNDTLGSQWVCLVDAQ